MVHFWICGPASSADFIPIETKRDIDSKILYHDEGL